MTLLNAALRATQQCLAREHKLMLMAEELTQTQAASGQDRRKGLGERLHAAKARCRRRQRERLHLIADRYQQMLRAIINAAFLAGTGFNEGLACFVRQSLRMYSRAHALFLSLDQDEIVNQISKRYFSKSSLPRSGGLHE